MVLQYFRGRVGWADSAIVSSTLKEGHGGPSRSQHTPELPCSGSHDSLTFGLDGRLRHAETASPESSL